jgi:hypothetical protein
MGVVASAFGPSGRGSLARYDEKPGVIPGWGPVITDVLPRIIDQSHDGEWRFGIHDQDRLLGAITHPTPTHHGPTALRRVRDPEWVFPTCRFDSIQSDLDHQHPWAHHRTTIEELEPLWLPPSTETRQLETQQDQSRQTSPLGHT